MHDAFVMLAAESVTVLGSVGLQHSKTYWCGLSATSFLPLPVVHDVIINEGITMVTS